MTITSRKRSEGEEKKREGITYKKN